MRRRIERDVRGRELFPLPPSPFPALEPTYRFFEPPQIHVEADGLHMPRLLAAQQIPGAAQLEIPKRNAIARS